MQTPTKRHAELQDSSRGAGRALSPPTPTLRASCTRLCPSLLAEDLHRLLSSVLWVPHDFNTGSHNKLPETSRATRKADIYHWKHLSVLITLNYTTEQKAYITQTNYMYFLVIRHKLFSLSQGKNIKSFFFTVEFIVKHISLQSPISLIACLVFSDFRFVFTGWGDAGKLVFSLCLLT